MADQEPTRRHRVLSDAQFREQTVQGGATRHASTLHEVTSGFGVGGMVTAAGSSFPEKPVHPVASLTEDQVREHLEMVREAFPDNQRAHQGSWVEDDTAYLDASDVFPLERQAHTETIRRGERAYYDFAKGESKYIKVAGKRSADQHPIRDWTP